MKATLPRLTLLWMTVLVGRPAPAQSVPAPGCTLCFARQVPRVACPPVRDRALGSGGQATRAWWGSRHGWASHSWHPSVPDRAAGRGYPLVAQTLPTSPAGRPRLVAGPPGSSASPPSASEPGAALVRRALVAIQSHQSVVATLRQRANLFGSQLFGTGSYLQQGRGKSMQVRLELKIQVAGQTRSMLQIADGRYLWTDWRQRDKRTVDRVDLGRVHTALERVARPAAGLGEWAFGGLPDVLANLAAGFQFATPQTSQLGKLPTWRLLGRRRPNADRPPGAGGINLGQPSSGNVAAAYIPDRVVLQLGREDLFPYVIEYRHGTQRGAGQGTRSRETVPPLVRIELFEVRINAPVDTRQFVYQPGDVEPKDRTDAYLARWRHANK